MITHNITLNVKNQNVVNTGIAVSQGDKGKVKFVIYVKDGDNYLSGAVSAEIAFNTPNGYIVTGNAVVENNSYTYVFDGNELQAAGDISAVITLTFQDGRVSSCGFAFYCRYNPMYDRNIDAGPYFGEIEALKSAAENALSDANGAVAQANAAKNAAEIAAGNAEAVAGIGIATTEKAGISKPDGTTLGIDAAGILRVLASGLKIKDTNGLIGTVNADVLLQTLVDDITNRVLNQILTKSMLINNGLTTESGKYPLDAAFGKTLADKDTELASSITQLNSDLKNFSKIRIAGASTVEKTYIVKTNSIYESFLIFGQKNSSNIFELVNTHNNDNLTIVRLADTVITYERGNSGALVLKIPDYTSVCIISKNDMSFNIN